MSNLEHYVAQPDTLQVIDDTGVERDIPVREFWMYEADALPGWITPQEHAQQNGLEYLITEIHQEIGGNDE